MRARRAASVVIGVTLGAAACGAASGSGVVVTGPDAGALPQVGGFDVLPATSSANFLGYSPSFTGGVRVAVGDVNGDGTPDYVLGPGSGGTPNVRVYSGNGLGLLQSYNAFAPAFTGGVYVAAGDINNDGKADLIAGAGAGGGPQVSVFSGADQSTLSSFFAYTPTFSGGVTVGAGDVNHDGRADIITAPASGSPANVKVFSGTDGSLLRSFFAYDVAFTGGAFVAAGDVNGDGFADIVTGTGSGGGPDVRVYSGADGSLLRAFFAYSPSFTGGVRVAAADVNGDGKAEIITAPGSGSTPNVEIFDGNTNALLGLFNAYSPSFTGGVFVAAATVPEPGAAASLFAAALALAARHRRSRAANG
jgi:hypothetical protein